MPCLVDHEFVLGVALEHAAHEADVVQEAGADEMGVVLGLDSLLQHPPAKDVAPDDRHQHRVLEIVVERVAPGDALDGAPRERAELLGGLVCAGPKMSLKSCARNLPSFFAATAAIVSTAIGSRLVLLCHKRWLKFRRVATA